MVSLGVSFEGYTPIPLKRLDSGHVVPDASVSELQDRHRDYLRQQVDAGKKAEAFGYDYVVHSEHHSTIDGPISPNPVLTQTAIARETDRIRLLQMANILPWHEPVRLAEQLAMLDVLSDGRVDVGVGRGMFDPAGSTLGQYWGGSRSSSGEVKNYQSFEEKYEILLEAWTGDFLSYNGQFHTIPPSYTSREGRGYDALYLADEVCEHEPEDFLSTSGGLLTQSSLPVQPQPQQSPHPQLWKPAGSTDSAAWAAERGMNICLHFSDAGRLEALTDAYYDAAAEAGWPDRRPAYDGEPFDRAWDPDRNRGIGVIVPILNTESATEDAIRRWKLSYEYSLTASEDLDVSDAMAGTQDPVDADVEGFLDGRLLPLRGGATEIADELNRIIDACGLDDVFLIVSADSKGLTHDEHLAQLELFARDVRPKLRTPGD